MVAADDAAVPRRWTPEHKEQSSRVKALGGSTPNAAVPSRWMPEQREQVVQPLGGSTPDAAAASRWMPEQTTGCRHAAASGSRKKKIRQEAVADNAGVTAMRRKFEDGTEDSTLLAQTKPKPGRGWKKTNPAEVKTGSGRIRQAKPTNSPKTPRIKRLSNPKLNRKPVKQMLLPAKPEKTLSKFRKLLQDWELSTT